MVSRLTRAGVIALAVLVAAGCSASDLTLSGPSATGSTTEREPAPEEVLDDPTDAAEAALADVEAFWADALPALYEVDLVPLRGGFLPYGPETAIPACGPQETSYDQLAGNAFYCPADDFIAWDDVALITPLHERFGPLTTGVVMAHEYAHAVQSRAEVRAPVVVLELQADCFAGAWVADASTRVPTFSTAGDRLDLAMAGMLELRDDLGITPQNNPQAHGSGFDRVGAFQDGYEEGAATCTGYAENPPPVFSIPFGSAADVRNEGNLPLDELVTLLVPALESWYARLFDDNGASWRELAGIEAVDPSSDEVVCDGEELTGEDLEQLALYCPSDATLYLDADGLVPALDAIGDFAFAGEVARLYAVAAQDQLGLDRDDLRADCLTGAYAAAQYHGVVPDSTLTLSPGDLDEVLIAFLAFGQGEHSAFERTAAFRDGFVDTAEACSLF